MNDSTCLAGGPLAQIRGKTKARELPRSLAFATTSFFLDLPGKSHSQLHRPAAAIEKEFIQKLGRGYENVARVQGVGVVFFFYPPFVARHAYAVLRSVYTY